jgi:hypothetical protein
MENELLTKMWVINLVPGEPGVGLKKLGWSRVEDPA